MECDLSKLCNPLIYMLASMCLVGVKEVKGFKYIMESSRFLVLLLRFDASFPVGGNVWIALSYFFI